MIRAFLALFLIAAAGATAAQGYPNKPIYVIVPFQAGSAPDQIFRITTQHMQKTLGQPFVIENKPGANGNIGVAEAARAAPDGYTLVSANNTTFAANPSLYKTLPFDPQKDFTPVARFITTGLILAVKSDFPAKDLEGVHRARQGESGEAHRPAQASAGNARIDRRCCARSRAWRCSRCPYKGQPQALQDVLGGQVSFTFADYAVGFPQIKAGKIRGLGVTTPKRSPVAPDIPTPRRRDPRLRRHGVGRDGGAGGHAARRGRHALARHRPGARQPGGAPGAPGDRLRRRAARPAGVRRLHRSRDRALGEDGERSRDRAGVAARLR
jgi:tripartite-type tricarboxylate transporter receptor subunit TctC